MSVPVADEVALLETKAEQSNSPEQPNDSNNAKEHDKDKDKEIDISYLELFGIFLWFGFRAWGGPVAQISMLKEELVIQRKWITPARFLRVLAVYQVFFLFLQLILISNYCFFPLFPL